MNTPKICVYAICKNEAQFIDRWYAAISEADEIIVVDTGSTDNSLEKLRAHPIHVYETKEPIFQFDLARNEALSYVSEDASICISLDLDEILSPNWYQTLISQWQEDVTVAKCRFVWHYNEDGSEGGVFWPIRIHNRHDYIWTHSIHEVLTHIGSTPEKLIELEGLEFRHYPDPTKKRNYLHMLEQAIQIHPEDARDHFYLGREYLYHSKWSNCLTTLKTYLQLPTALWNEERSTAYRYMAKASFQLNRDQEGLDYLQAALNEAPYLREPYIDFAYYYYSKKNWYQTATFADAALQITHPSQTFVNEGSAWDATPYDLGCIAHFNMGHYEQALTYALKCLDYAPTNARFVENVAILKRFINSNTY